MLILLVNWICNANTIKINVNIREKVKLFALKKEAEKYDIPLQFDKKYFNMYE